jgi:hypothetical protein
MSLDFCNFFHTLIDGDLLSCTEEENKLHISLFYSIKKQDWM